MCNALLQPWLEMVCGHRRDVFSGPIEACPLSCVLVVRANGTCIPVILVDGTFLTGKYKGTLMMDVVVDPEDQIVHMAFALAEGDNNES